MSSQANEQRHEAHTISKLHGMVARTRGYRQRLAFPFPIRGPRTGSTLRSLVGAAIPLPVLPPIAITERDHHAVGRPIVRECEHSRKSRSHPVRQVFPAQCITRMAYIACPTLPIFKAPLTRSYSLQPLALWIIYRLS